MDSQVQEVKQRADIVAVVGERVKLKKAGRNFVGLCPFHGEKTPSFNVSSELQIFKCFGCGESGDVFSFLEKFEGMDFAEALKYVADKVGVKLVSFRPTGAQSERETLLSILNLAAEFYHYILTSHKLGETARKYWQQRGIWKQTIEMFKLGWAPEGWDNLYKYLVNKKGYKVYDVEKAGLVIRAQNYYDRFRGRVMFPLTNQRGQVVGLAGRILDVQAKEAKYVNTPETEVYHKSELLYGLAVTKGEMKKADRVVVVEGEVDMLSSWQAGVKNVVAIKGSAFTEEQLRLISRYTKNISLALDADSAGDEATRRSIVLADSLGLNVRVVEMVGGKDPDEIAQSGKDKWRKLVDKAVNVYDFYLDSACKRWDVNSGEGKREISRYLAPILAGIGNSVEQAHYVSKLAGKLGVSEETVGREIDKASKGLEKAGEEKQTGAGVTVEEYLLGVLLKSGKDMADKAKRVKLEWLETGAVKRVVELLGQERQEIDIGRWTEGLPEELKEVVARAWMGEFRDEEEKNFEKLLMRLEKKWVQGRLRVLSEGMKQAEIDKREQKLVKLQQEFVEVSKRLKELAVEVQG